MAIQITLTDEDYAALSIASQQSGVPVETLVHEAIAARYVAPATPKQQGVYSYPNGKPVDPKLLIENERIAMTLKSDRPWASDMVIEDRGPR